MQEQPQQSLDLDRLIVRYGTKLAEAELSAEVAEQRAERAEANVAALQTEVAEITSRLDELEGDTKGPADGY